jgi:nicotinamidase-related amidase
MAALLIVKPRMSALWGYQSELDLYLAENGIKTLIFTGVNADQVRPLKLRFQTC